MSSITEQKLDARQAIMEHLRRLLEERDKDYLLNSALGFAVRVAKKMSLGELLEWEEGLQELEEKGEEE
ncbi:MAG: hypothetical protein H8D43_04395 [Chloroflexi bacterium]|nr:hypothetical protein [Chloroflexota bacterium]